MVCIKNVIMYGKKRVESFVSGVGETKLAVILS